MLHAFYVVIFVKLADISHSSATMKVTVLCRHSKTGGMTRLNFTHKTKTMCSYRPDAGLNSSKLKQKNPPKTPATKPFKIAGLPKGYLTSQLYKN